MKTTRLLIGSLLMLACGTAWGAKPQTPRTRTNLDPGWRFFLGDDAAASAPAFDDTKWQRVDLPHSFSEPYFRAPDFYIGYGWYRRHLSVDSSTAHAQNFLEFEGVFQDAEVFVNGNAPVNTWAVTPASRWTSPGISMSGDNVIAVRVNNLWNGQLNPRAGEHVFSGGIYRDVSLVTTAPVHVPWYGTFVTTPKVSNDDATVDVKTELRNSSAASAAVVLRTAILDPSGKQVGEYTSRQTIDPGALVTVDQSGDRSYARTSGRPRPRNSIVRSAACT